MMVVSDEKLVAEALRRVAHIGSLAGQARALGVSESTVRRWRAGEVSTPLRLGTREPLERFLGDRGPRSGGVRRKPGVAAEELLDFLKERVGLGALAQELTTKDLVAAAYTLARGEGFGAEDYRRLDEWRDRILERERAAQ